MDRRAPLALVRGHSSSFQSQPTALRTTAARAAAIDRLGLRRAMPVEARVLREDHAAEAAEPLGAVPVPPQPPAFEVQPSVVAVEERVGDGFGSRRRLADEGVTPPPLSGSVVRPRRTAKPPLLPPRATVSTKRRTHHRPNQADPVPRPRVLEREGQGPGIGPEPVNCARVFVNCSIEFKPATWLHQNKSKTFSCARKKETMCWCVHRK